ncbi:hypothetical protein GCM10023168_02770 [Fodinibacter luteus]|uniref:DUF1269 domain-containing protein n=1 Tax=Fodinibacter luteus TaxID=552064 RepID=A0ABP8JXX0_9MICO
MTTTATVEAHGPIDFVLIEFPSDERQTEAADALFELVEAGTVRLLDLLVVRKYADGTLEIMDLNTLGGEASFSRFVGARSGLLGEDDVDEAGAALGPGTTAALIVYENSWAAPFVAAVRRGGGELVASTRIPASDVMDALDALESTESE